MGGPAPVARELVESDQFADWIDGFSHARLDEVLRAILWAVSTNAEAFPIVEGFKDIRIVKTSAIEFGPSMMPGLRVWFRIAENNQQVYLEHIEPDPWDE